MPPDEPNALRTWLLRAGIFYVLASLAGCAAMNTILYPAPPPGYTPEQTGRWITAADGTRIAALWLPNPSARHTLLFSHGNGEDIGYCRPLLDELVAAGFSVYAYDYRGYGRSGGRPSEQGTLLDIRAAWDDLTGPLGVKPSDILLLGRSLGGGVSFLLAREVQPAGIITLSTFTSVFRVVTRVGLLPFDRYTSLHHIRGVKCPLLLMHGENDRVIPFSHGQTLFERASAPRRFIAVAGADHNDFIEVMGSSFFAALRQFSREVADGAVPAAERIRHATPSPLRP